MTFVLIMVAAGLLALALLAVRLRDRAGAAAVLAAVVCVAVAYDNFAVAAGRSIGDGDLLRLVSTGRFWLHALVTPLLVPLGWALAVRLGALRSTGRGPVVLVGLVTAALVLVGVGTEIVGLRLERRTYADTLRHVNAAAEGPPVAALVTIALLTVLGVLVAVRGGGPWLLVGAVVMLVAAALGTRAFWLGNLGELALLGGTVGTAYRGTRRPATGGRPGR
ncbi:hypothetical protein [Micromonospora echinofusca]|uniref:PAP2 superfamily protein n=1 Tax=Micromonospora echinofusca TaxID=47858 RepID=A0ABS3VXX0_MICEH|nr:hypothetical protein [Micromonospora echinofusca]MBO4209384.1 hypothetical protein [Micromonospora echinofusca]